MYTTPQVSTREQTAHRISTTDTGHGSTLWNNECKENIDGEEVTIWQWISHKIKTNRGLRKSHRKSKRTERRRLHSRQLGSSTECTGSSQSSSSRSECNTHTDQRSNGRAGSSIPKLEYGVQKLHLEVAVEEAEKILAHPENYEDIAALESSTGKRKSSSWKIKMQIRQQ